MIFVTVGTDGPFDRLISTIDEWAGRRGHTDVVAQIGRSRLTPRHIRANEFIDPVQFRDWFSKADVIVAHAGMGTILSALRYRKPILVMPRRASLGEQRNEHQLATARRLLDLKKVHVAFDEAALLERLDRLDELSTAGQGIGPYAEPRLTSALHGFIHRS